MAAKSAWSLLDNPNLTQNAAELGKYAVANGLISPQEALQKAQAMGYGPGGTQTPSLAAGIGDGAQGGDNPLNIGTEPQASGPLSMTAQPSSASLYDQVSGVGDRKGAKETASAQSNLSLKHSAQHTILKSPAMIQAQMKMAQGITPGISGYEPMRDAQGNPMLDKDGQPVLDQDSPIYDSSKDQTDPSHPVQQQLAGLNNMQDLLRMTSDANKERSTLDLSPLARMADFVNASSGVKSNLAEGYKAPESKTNEILSALDELQKRRADVQKGVYENARLMNGGSTTDQLLQALLLKNGAEQSNPTFDRMQAQQQRMDFMAHQRNITALKKDPAMLARLYQAQNIQNSLTNFAAADTATPQQFDELQQAIRANLGIKGSSGVGERERTQLNSLGISADRINQLLTGNPQDIGKDSALASHIKQLAALEGSNIHRQVMSRINFVTGGNGSVYERNPDLADDLQQIMGAAAAQYGTSAVGAGKGAKKRPAQTPIQKAIGAGAGGAGAGGAGAGGAGAGTTAPGGPMSIDQFFGKGK